MGEFLEVSRRGAVVTLTMNQPGTRNALTGNTAADELVEACERIGADPSVRVAILTAAGSVFSSGGNVKDLGRYVRPEVTPQAIREEYRRGIQRVPRAFHELEVPTIAAVNGAAIGAGCDLACMCDLRIASENATFAEKFVQLGLIAGDGGAWLLPRAIGMARAAEMAFTGDEVSAQEALAMGLVSRVVPADELLPEANRLADRIAKNPGHAVRMTKRLLREGQQAPLEAVLELAAGLQALAHKTPQFAEALRAFLERRAPAFTDD